MKQNWKSSVAKATGGYPKLDRKMLKIKKSWDEVSGLLNTGPKKRKK